MTDRPIIFSGPMVRALLDGRKTQTRRLLKAMPPAPEQDSLVHPPRHDAPYFDAYCGGKRTAANPRGMTDHWCWWTRDDRVGHGCRVGYVPGDRLWVKERYTVQQCSRWTSMAGQHLDTCIDYAADGQREWIRFMEAEAPKIMKEVKDRNDGQRAMAPAIFLPKPASRLTLIVETVRVERLNDISRVDAIAEGLALASNAIEEFWRWPKPYHENLWLSPPAAYRHLWNELHGADAWDANPFVVAITFRVERGNIDQIGVPA